MAIARKIKPRKWTTNPKQRNAYPIMGKIEAIPAIQATAKQMMAMIAILLPVSDCRIGGGCW
jgi:hypothetical protein